LGGRHLVGDPDHVAGCRVLHADGGVNSAVTKRKTRGAPRVFASS
jgi:hypothetical protein